MSYITYLQCSHCDDHFNSTRVQTFCTKCQTPLLARYDFVKARQELDRDEIYRRSRGMWRWRELLPVLDERNMVTLGEGDAPLLPLPNLGTSLGLENLYVKDESLKSNRFFQGSRHLCRHFKSQGVRD